MIKQCLIIATIFLLSGDILAQNCTVKVDSLKGQYKGDCKDGKADGQGAAFGTDTYTGEFRKGLPEGLGRYTWSNGDWYEGFWKEGKFEGKGTLSRKAENTSDSLLVLTGFWEKGKFLGLHAKPYYIEMLTNNINDLTIRKLDETKSDINISVRSITGGASILQMPVLPKTLIVDIQLFQGRFEQIITDTVSRITSRYTLQDVKFPFSAIFSFRTPGPALWIEKVKVEFYEKGNWVMRVDINN